MSVRVFDFADGFTSNTNPATSGVAASELVTYSSDAAYEAAHGAAQDGNTYYNTTDNKVRIYENGAWVENASFEA